MTSHVYGGVALALRRVAAQRGCQVVVVPVALDATDDEIVAAIGDVVDADTACIVIDQITSATAKVMPARRVAELGRSRGVPVIVDGAHSPGLLDDPVTGDFWAGNLHKWPCAPRGTGVLYVAAERQAAAVPSVVSWGDPLGFPVAFDAPGTMDASGWLATPTSLDLLTTLGFADRRKGLGVLLDAGATAIVDAVGGSWSTLVRRLRRCGWCPSPTAWSPTTPAGSGSGPTSRRAPVRRSRSPAGTRGFLRVSAHLYNTSEDYTATASRYAVLFADPGLRTACA